METFLVDIETQLIATLNVILGSAGVLFAGVAAIAAGCLTLWAIYKTFLIMAGMTADPFLSFFKGFVIKATILTIASSPLFFDELVTNFLINSTKALTNNLNSSTSGSVFQDVGPHFDTVVNGLTIVTTSPPSDGGGVWDTLVNTKNAIWASSNYIFGSYLTEFSHLIKFLIMSTGIVYLCVCLFSSVVINQIMAYISLTFGPLFFVFSIFNTTKTWFWSWLNVTIGYLFTYIAVMLAWGTLFGVLNGFFYVPSAGNPLTWSDTFQMFLTCIFSGKSMLIICNTVKEWFSDGRVSNSANKVSKRFS